MTTLVNSVLLSGILLGMLPRETFAAWPRRYIQEVYSSILYNSPNWKQPKCQSVGESISIVLYLYDGVLYSGGNGQQLYPSM